MDWFGLVCKEMIECGKTAVHIILYVNHVKKKILSHIYGSNEMTLHALNIITRIKFIFMFEPFFLLSHSLFSTSLHLIHTKNMYVMWFMYTSISNHLFDSFVAHLHIGLNESLQRCELTWERLMKYIHNSIGKTYRLS